MNVDPSPRGEISGGGGGTLHMKWWVCSSEI